jgi:hypothetical protein
VVAHPDRLVRAEPDHKPFSLNLVTTSEVLGIQELPRGSDSRHLLPCPMNAYMAPN